MTFQYSLFFKYFRVYYKSEEKIFVNVYISLVTRLGTIYTYNQCIRCFIPKIELKNYLQRRYLVLKSASHEKSWFLVS